MGFGFATPVKVAMVHIKPGESVGYVVSSSEFCVRISVGLSNSNFGF